MALYNSRGNMRVTVSDTSMPFGIYAADGSLRITVVDGNTRTGLYAADGSFNVVVVGSTDTPISIYHPCGALRGVSASSETGLSAPNGAIYMDGLTTSTYTLIASTASYTITGVAATLSIDTAPVPAVLSGFVDDLELDPPALLFDSDQAGTVYFDYHTSITPPASPGGGDVGFYSTSASAGANSFSLDLSDYSSLTFYVHIRLVNANGTSNTLTSQEITVALADVPQHFYPISGGAQGTFGAQTLATLQTNSSYWLAYCDQASEAMGINYVGILIGAVTSCNITVTIEGVSATDGQPDGVPIASSASTAVTANSYNLIALTSQANIAKGAMYAVKFAYTSGTSAVIQRIQFTTLGGQSAGRPYQVIATGGAGAKAALSLTATLALGSSATSFYELPWSIPGAETFAANTYNSGSSPAVRGMRVSLPFAARLIGIRYLPQNWAGDFNIVVYDASNNELSSSSTAIDSSQLSTSTNDTNTLYFDNAVTLSRNTVYYVSIEPTSVTNVSLPTLTLDSTDYAAATPWGTELRYATRTAGTWSSTAGQLPMMALVFDQR